MALHGVRDDGYIVVEVQYANQNKVVEDYIDLVSICERLYMDAQKFVEPIKKVEIQ